METAVDETFAKTLPKVELHAHLSGSISKQTLNKIWKRKRSEGHCVDLDDPLLALKSMPDIFTFFKIFDQYIYKLMDDRESLREAAHSVLNDFEDDGVTYIEIRTTPRGIAAANMNAEEYVKTVLQTMADRPQRCGTSGLQAHLILSIDRRMDTAKAAEVLELATKYRQGGQWHQEQVQRLGNDTYPSVVAIDLCGNPMMGDVSAFSDIFTAAKARGLRTTVHFAEVPQSSTYSELETILSWQPDRLGHVINVSDKLKAKIEEQGIGLELCLSCNMIAKMVPGEYADHHFGYWLGQDNVIALSTDDVGVFESSLSNEYLLAAKHFKLSRSDLIALARRATMATFSPADRTRALIDTFARTQGQAG